MRPRSNDELTTFLGAVRRRLILVRAVEGAGAGIAISSGFSLVLALLLLSLGRDAMMLCVLALAAGAMIGAAWQMLRRPTLDDVAMEADRQLELSDLLASAWMRRGDDDPWQRTVVALAAQRCATLSPSAMMLNRFGGRAWGGIGLSAALVTTIGALSMSTQRGVATTPAAVIGPLPQRVAEQARPPRVTANVPPAQRAADAAHSAIESREESGATRRGEDSPPDQRSAHPGDGTAQARTQVDPAVDRASPRDATAHAPNRDATEMGAGGAGRAAEAGQPAAAAGSGTTADKSTSKPPPARPDGLDAAAAPGHAERQGVKDEYRDVLRRYFHQP